MQFVSGLVVTKVVIQSIVVPRFVENGTTKSIVLDCLYTLDPKEDTNLVVKWFLDDDPVPIYQWIAELDARYTSSRLKGRLNLDFVAMSDTQEQYQKYRALNILRPTIDLRFQKNFSNDILLCYGCHVRTSIRARK